MNEAVISLGSNVVYAREHLEKAILSLSDIIVAITPLYYDSQKPPYLNAVARVVTEMSLDELSSRFKQIESSHGRTPESKRRGLIELDIDTVIFNGGTIRPADICQEYFQRGYRMLSAPVLEP